MEGSHSTKTPGFFPLMFSFGYHLGKRHGSRGRGRGNKVFLFSLRKGLKKRGKGEMKVDESVKVCGRDSNEMSFLPLIALGMISPASYERVPKWTNNDLCARFYQKIRWLG